MTDSASPHSLTVIATRLPYIDRRSLSQAWFSALHVASDGPVAARSPERRIVAPTVSGARPSRGTTVAMAENDMPARARVPRTAPNAAGAELATRRTYDARTAAAARATFQRDRSYPPFRSSLTLVVAKERVQLLLRRDGATLHVVAVCRPEIADTVRRALAAADAHLRVRGESVRSSVELAGVRVRA